MINFRFHLASLVAIFLALALGVVIGAGVIDRGVVDALDTRLDSVVARSDRLEGENDELRTQVSEKDGAIAALGALAVDARLTNADVGVIAVRGVDGDRVQETVAALQSGGAQVTGVLWLESAWKLENDEQIAAMADAVGSTSRRPTVLRAQAWEQLARRFSNPVTGEVASGQPIDDVLVALQDAGFVGFDATDGGGSIAQFPGVAPMLVLAVGTEGDVPASDVVMPAATTLTAADLPLVVGDGYVAPTTPATNRGDDLATLRDSDLSERVSTVNDLDRPQGPVTVALALADLLHIPPVVGHYGIGVNTTLLPAPVPT
jgi:hypothetical protein